MRRAPFKIEQRERLCPTAGPDDMRLAAGDEDEITVLNAHRSPLLKYDGGRTPTEIMEDGIRSLRKRHVPWTTELVVE
jgi:hypothetical protein